MAKGQMRSNKEAKKPKKTKEVAVAPVAMKGSLEPNVVPKKK